MDLYRRSFTKRIDTPADTEVAIFNHNGAVEVQTHEEAAVTVEVTADIYASSAEDADAELARIEAGIERTENRVVIRVPDTPPESIFPRAPSVSYAVRSPAGSRVFAENLNGRISVSGPLGAVDMKALNGRVQVTGAGGPVKVDSLNGKVDVSRCAGSVEVTGLNGQITIESVDGPVTAQTENGAVQVVDCRSGVKAATRNGGITYRGHIGGNAEYETENGSVRLTVSPDSAFAIDAESEHGVVRTDFPIGTTPPDSSSESIPTVRVRSFRGSIQLSYA